MTGFRQLTRSSFVVALVTSIFGWLVVAGAILVGTQSFPTLEMLSRADGVHYLAISTSGYEFFKCSDTYWPGGWCGNAAWQPLYPLFIRMVSITGLSPAVSGLLITAVAGLVFSLLSLKDSARTGSAAWRLGLLIAVAPGMVWMHAVFPITLLLVWSLLAFRGASAGAGWQSAIWASLAILTHSSGIFIAFAVLIMLVFSSRSIVKQLSSFITIVLASVVLWLGSLQLLLGTWQAWWLVQAKYYAMSGGPIDRLKALKNHLLNAFILGSSPADLWTSIQSWLVLFLCIAAIWNVLNARGSRKQGLAEISKISILGLFPFIVGGLLSVSRNQAQSTLFFSRVRVGVWTEILLIVIFTIVGAQTSQLFLTGWID